jgi:hypothetical protein
MERIPRPVDRLLGALRRRAPAGVREQRRQRRRWRRQRRRAAPRHAFEEAGLHVTETVSELADWIRLGR